MQQASRTGQPIASVPSAWVRLQAALADFRTRWTRVRPRRSGDLRQFEAGIVALLSATIFLTAWGLDERGAFWASRLSPDVVRVFGLITRLGESGYIFILSAVIAIGSTLARGRGARPTVDATLGLLAGRAVFVFAVTSVSGVFAQILKHLFGRARPRLMDMVGPFHFDVFSLSARLASFPSGHTVTAFATALTIGWFAPRWRWPLLGVAALVGVSRVAVGAHYPSDVLAGALLGIGSALLLRKSFATRRIVFRPSGRSFAARRARPIWTAIRRMPIG